MMYYQQEPHQLVHCVGYCSIGVLGLDLTLWYIVGNGLL